MSDPDGPVSDPTAGDSLRHQSSAAGDLGNLLPDTFAAWLKELKPALDLSKNLVPATRAVRDQPAEGELRFEGTLRVDGYIVGRLRSLTGTLIVSETGEIESDIVVATAIIDGILRGDLHATERVELQSHAKVLGNIVSPALAIQPGALFDGECHFLASPAKASTEESTHQDKDPGESSFSQTRDSVLRRTPKKQNP